MNVRKCLVFAAVGFGFVGSFNVLALPRLNHPAIGTSSVGAGESSTPAGDCLYKGSVSEQLKDLYTPVGIVGEADRMSPKDCARKKGLNEAELVNKVRATGSLECGGKWLSTANVVGATNVIVTVGHAITEDGTRTCNDIRNPPNCTFKYEKNGKKYSVKVASVVGVGLDCRNKNTIYDDWAVLKLSKGIDVEPYQLPDESESISEGQIVTTVAAQAMDYGPIENGHIALGGKYMGCDCDIKYVKRTEGKDVVVASNCDMAKWASGGALLNSELLGVPKIMAVYSGSRERTEDLKRAVEVGRPNTGDYDLDTWAAFHVPIQGAFYQAVRAAIGEPVVN